MISSENWSDVDEQNWAAFLRSDTGKRLLPRLAAAVPELLAAGEINHILIRSGEVRGANIVLAELFAMSHSAPTAPAPPTAYPDLEDDSQWPGEKLNVS